MSSIAQKMQTKHLLIALTESQSSFCVFQLAVIDRGERVEEPPSTSGRPFMRPWPTQKSFTERRKSWSEDRLGLLPGFGAVHVLLALMSDAQDALLQFCSEAVRFSFHLLIYL